MNQLATWLHSISPINTEKFSRQNRMIYNHLASGKTITTLQAEKLFGVRNLHSRIPELRHVHHVVIFDRMIKVTGPDGIPVYCKEYSLTPFEA